LESQGAPLDTVTPWRRFPNLLYRRFLNRLTVASQRNHQNTRPRIGSLASSILFIQFPPTPWQMPGRVFKLPSERGSVTQPHRAIGHLGFDIL
jgi:hypothetical protein